MRNNSDKLCPQCKIRPRTSTSGYCTPCGTLLSIANRNKKIAAGVPCTRCNQHPRKYGSYCAVCWSEMGEERYANDAEKVKEQVRQWRETNKVRCRENDLLRKYGLTIEDFVKLLEYQDNKCAICKRVLETPHVDHDHKSGKTRGLLCRHCNDSLGKLMDSPDVLRAAASYLEGDTVPEKALGGERYGMPGSVRLPMRERRRMALESGVPLEKYRTAWPEVMSRKWDKKVIKHGLK